jgi:hypothetical protein
MIDLKKFKVQDIAGAYKKLGREMQEYDRIKNKFLRGRVFVLDSLEFLHFKDFENRWVIGVVKTNNMLSVLDKEIARRNKLIGVL